MDNSKRSAKGWRTRIDKKALEGYEKQLRNRRREYGQFAEAYSKTGRRNQALAVGECVLKALDSSSAVISRLISSITSPRVCGACRILATAFSL